MINNELKLLLSQAKYEILENGEGYYGEIEVCPGVWAQGDTLEECGKELSEVLEEWNKL